MARRLESVAETALSVLAAASVTLNYREDADRVRSLVNVGELGPGEQRWPRDEIYPLMAFPETRAMFSGAAQARHITYVDDADGEPGEVDLLRQLGKAGCLKVPVIAGGHVWGELWATRHSAQPRFGERDVQRAQILAAVLAIALPDA